ncbi:50S ribosomal protein L35 [Candidatus Peregrinibacteria bacterium]|nr:50S ribosomal protein L35 [Candidatus Peregrinibacteria bacterium]
MPGKAKPGKQRNSSAAKKRIKRTGRGAFAHEKAAHNHLLQQKSKKQKRLSGRALKVSGSTKILKRILPN